MIKTETLRREIHPVIEPVAGSAPVIDFIASDETLDRYGEVIVASGWRLENYRRNPIVQNSHQYGDILFTLGKAVVTEVRDMGAGRACLFQRIEFATDVNPMARIAHGLYKGRFLNAMSVGFVPIRWETGGARDEYSRRFIEQELLEVSAVAIPANPNALQLALEAGAVRRTDLRELAELIEAARSEVEDFSDEKSGAKADRCAQGLDMTAARLSHLQTVMNQIRELFAGRN